MKKGESILLALIYIFTLFFLIAALRLGLINFIVNNFTTIYYNNDLGNLIVRKLGLPDTYDTMEILNGKLRIRCFGGTTVDEVLPSSPRS
ncbi:hypothetical protein [Chitinophaga parva]|nr:hypothetical protein [Chitinophaga parva]